MAFQQAKKKKRHVSRWSDAEKRKVLQLWEDHKQSNRATVMYLSTSPLFAGSAFRRIDRKTLRLWIKTYEKLEPGEKPKARGRPRNEEFERA
eukprot:364196-Rhodomonas_salina.1